ncbi:hypothetical protein PG989_004274 [Apiospora arundinis]
MDLFPIEIWCAIFRLLDPIGLIAASQSCQQFRQIIQPRRVHFVERLLALECQLEHGGPAQFHYPPSFERELAWEDESWTRMRWACTGCMRLLPDAAFDNHSLVRLGHRKPEPGTASSRVLTSWEPSAMDLLHRKWRAKNRDSLRAQEKKTRKQYAIALTRNWGIPKDTQDPVQRLQALQDAGLAEFVHCGLEYFQCMDPEEEQATFDRAAAAIEAERTGLRRHLRRCNECRFQRGEMKVLRHLSTLAPRISGPNVGTDRVPIVRSRQVLLSSALDRWFPGWSTVLLRAATGEAEANKNNRPPETGPTAHLHNTHKLRQNLSWTLYMVRCPDCARWQELRAFRCGRGFDKWQPNPERAAFENWDGSRLTEQYIDSLTCNACFREKHGDERLARDLMLWWDMLAASEMGRLESDMSLGWRIIKTRPTGTLNTKEDEGGMESDQYPLSTEGIPLDPWHVTVLWDELSVSDRADLRARQRRFADWVRGRPDRMAAVDEDEPGGVRRAYMEYWANSYGAMDSWWFWLQHCRDAFKAKPELLLMEKDFVAGVIRRGAELERPMEWREKDPRIFTLIPEKGIA